LWRPVANISATVLLRFVIGPDLILGLWRHVTRKPPEARILLKGARDITELKNAEEQLRTLHQELAKVSRQTTMASLRSCRAANQKSCWS
jgi:hypothetical protein